MAELHAVEFRRVFRYLAAIVAAALVIAGNLATLRRSAPKDQAELVLDRLQRFTDRMCQCNDNRCAQQVSDELTHWAQQLPPSTRDLKPQPATLRRAQAIGEQLAKCMGRAMDGSSEAPATEPQPSDTAP